MGACATLFALKIDQGRAGESRTVCAGGRSGQRLRPVSNGGEARESLTDATFGVLQGAVVSERHDQTQ